MFYSINAMSRSRGVQGVWTPPPPPPPHPTHFEENSAGPPPPPPSLLKFLEQESSNTTVTVDPRLSGPQVAQLSSIGNYILSVY